MPRREGIWTSKKISNITKVILLTIRKLILFIVSCGLFLIFLGSILLVFYSLYQAEYKDIRPAIVIGQYTRIPNTQTGISCNLRTSPAGWRCHDPAVLGGSVPQAVQGDQERDRP
jgi:hypothetical protein